MGEERRDDVSGDGREEETGRESGPATPGAPAFDAKLHADGVTFDSGDAALLRGIDDAGSLNAAADGLDRSFSRAHKRLSTLEEAFGTLVESRRGGVGGGGSVLTGRARGLLARFERLRTEFAGVADVAETVLDGRVVDREGELAVVETAAGRLRALAPPGASVVHVTVRADTVTLHGVAAAPPASETSARNRFEGRVVGIEDGEAVASVRVDVGADRPLLALVTARSRRELGLQRGSAVLASFKTTATRATPRR